MKISLNYKVFKYVCTLETEDDVKGSTNGNCWIKLKSILFDYNFNGGRFVRQCFTDSQKKEQGLRKTK